jgi:hypothetical protein
VRVYPGPDGVDSVTNKSARILSDANAKPFAQGPLRTAHKPSGDVEAQGIIILPFSISPFTAQLLLLAAQNGFSPRSFAA